jgi:hypothetical protein
VEWLFPHYWPAAVDPMMWWGASAPCAEPTPDRGHGGPDDLDVVRIVYGVLVEGAACGICGAPLDPATGVRRAGGLFTAVRIAVVTHCRSPQRHRHRATVVERAGDLRWGQLRPARARPRP